MNKPLLLSLATITVLSSSLNAESMLERFNDMQNQIQELQQEVNTLKAKESLVEKEEVTLLTTQKEEDDSDDEEEKDEDDESGEDDESEEDDEKINIEEEFEDIEESISELNKATSGNHLKFNVDYRFAVENMQYKLADGSKAKNDAFMTNRFWLNMNWKATKNLSFKAQAAYNKAFGARSGASAGNAYETFDWIANENAYDDMIRIRQLYFLYKNDTFLGSEIPWTFSVGRRPSVGGHLINYREDDQASSPLAHTINVEFDGASAKFSFDKYVDGMFFKLCAGRGMSNAAPKFTSTPYAEVTDDNTNIDLVGLIFVPYNNGQYSINTQYYYANNLIDAKNPMDQTAGFDTVGGMHSATANITINGIGNEWSDFLDDTLFFISGAVNITDPKNDQGMLGSDIGESVTGSSYWVGTQFPSLISEDGRWGIEYNHGSEYWRSITYGEDTNIGSKVAARGNAYEAYFTEYLVEDILSLQVRYTYIDYDYSGSNGFFGNTTGYSMEISDTMMSPMGNMASNIVDTAQDIRFYLRYRY